VQNDTGNQSEPLDGAHKLKILQLDFLQILEERQRPGPEQAAEKGLIAASGKRPGAKAR
jgi:hypothetical protein